MQANANNNIHISRYNNLIAPQTHMINFNTNSSYKIEDGDFIEI